MYLSPESGRFGMYSDTEKWRYPRVWVLRIKRTERPPAGGNLGPIQPSTLTTGFTFLGISLRRIWFKLIQLQINGLQALRLIIGLKNMIADQNHINLLSNSYKHLSTTWEVGSPLKTQPIYLASLKGHILPDPRLQP